MREQLGRPAELLTRDSATLGRSRAAIGMLRGGLAPEDVGAAVRRTRATVVHAHNLNPALGWRALAAAREAGARVVLHLHNYRLVCAVATCFIEGSDCVRCHGRDTRPGVRHNCRGRTSEALVYATALALWQRRLVAQSSVVVVPSQFAAARLRELGAPLGAARLYVVAPVLREFSQRSEVDWAGPALIASRLAAEKGVEVAIDACRAAGIGLIVAGDGPRRAALQAHARGADVSFTGLLEPHEVATLRRQASLALVPSLGAETFGLAAAEAMASGVPVVASRVGALPELVEARALARPGDAAELAARIVQLRGDRDAGDRGIAAARGRCAPETVARDLKAVYAAAESGEP